MRSLWLRPKLGIAAAAGAAAIWGLPWVVVCCTGSPAYFQQVIDLILIWSLVALSLTFLAGSAGQVSLGQGGFVAVGAYANALVTLKLGWPTWSGYLLACALASLTGVLIGLPALRLRGPYLVMATLAFAAIVHGVATNWISVTEGPSGISGIPSPEPFGKPIFTEFEFYPLLVSAVVVAMALVELLTRSQRGIRIRAVRDDELAAAAIGIRPAYEKTVSFAISAAIAGLAGALLSSFVGYISPDFFTIDQSILALTMAIMGGVFSVWGGLVGASVLLVVAEYMRGFAQYQLITYGIAIILVVTIIPTGILGGIERLFWRVRARKATRAEPTKGALTDGNRS